MTPDGRKSIDFGSYGISDIRTFDTGVTYREFEVIEVLLGQGNDVFTVDGNASDAITVIHGGGNTPSGQMAGGDLIHVKKGGGANAPLIIFGDTGQNGIGIVIIDHYVLVH